MELWHGQLPRSLEMWTLRAPRSEGEDLQAETYPREHGGVVLLLQRRIFNELHLASKALLHMHDHELLKL